MSDELKDFHTLTAETTPATPLALCEKCGLRVATPAVLVKHERVGGNGPADLVCTACGHEWVERNGTHLILTWYSAGLHAGREEAENEESAREIARALSRGNLTLPGLNTNEPN